jgi:hypothetical protein
VTIWRTGYFFPLIGARENPPWRIFSDFATSARDRASIAASDQSGTCANVETNELVGLCRSPGWNLEINSPRIEVDESGDELSFSPMPGLELVFS